MLLFSPTFLKKWAMGLLVLIHISMGTFYCSVLVFSLSARPGLIRTTADAICPSSSSSRPAAHAAAINRNVLGSEASGFGFGFKGLCSWVSRISDFVLVLGVSNALDFPSQECGKFNLAPQTRAIAKYRAQQNATRDFMKQVPLPLELGQHYGVACLDSRYDTSSFQP